MPLASPVANGGGLLWAVSPTPRRRPPPWPAAPPPHGSRRKRLPLSGRAPALAPAPARPATAQLTSRPWALRTKHECPPPGKRAPRTSASSHRVFCNRHSPRERGGPARRKQVAPAVLLQPRWPFDHICPSADGSSGAVARPQGTRSPPARCPEMAAAAEGLPPTQGLAPRKLLRPPEHLEPFPSGSYHGKKYYRTVGSPFSIP